VQVRLAPGVYRIEWTDSLDRERDARLVIHT
jgi:hypothetical protein